MNAKLNKTKIYWLVILGIIIIAVSCGVIYFLNLKNKNLILKDWDYKSDYKGIEVEVLDSIFSEAGSSVSVIWRNGTDKMIHYGEEFKLYKEVGGKWKECSIVGPNDILPLLHSLKQKSYNYEDFYLTHFDILKKGSYRIEQEYYFDEDATNKYSLEIYFKLGYE